MFQIFVFICIHLFATLSCYEIILERAENPYLDPSFGSVNMTLVKYNRTTNVLNAYLSLVKDVPLDVQLTVELYGMYTNEYRLLPIHIIRPFCGFLKLEMQFIINEMHGHIPTHCPIKKGFYYMTNFRANSAKFPANVFRTNRFRLDMNATWNKKIIGTVRVYVLVDEDVEFRKGYTKSSTT